MNPKSMLTTLAVLLTVAVPREAESSNGIVEEQFPYTEIHDYVECLGEGIEHELTITTRTHTIERPNGGVHQVLHWFIEGYSYGLTSGLTWYTRHAPSPWIVNASGDQSSQGWNVQVLWKPLDGGRQFRETWRFWVVTDANGVPRVNYDGGVQFHCTGR